MIIFRKYQQKCINKATRALIERGNTIGVAPTGAGKTIIMSGIVNNLLILKKVSKVLFLCHRQEINQQNFEKFIRVTGVTPTLFISAFKSIKRKIVFGMVQTVYRSYDKLPAFDMIVVDEGHHSCAESYDTIIEDQKRKNPNLIVLLITATPNRGDRQGLIKYVDNVAFQVFIKDLIKQGFLVKPTPISIPLNTFENRHHLAKEENYDFVNRILYKKMQKHEVFKRKTIIFCRDFNQVDSVKDYLEKIGIETVTISSELNAYDRSENLRKFEENEVDIILNVDVLTEGYDYPPADCIIVLRAVGNKSLYMQMVGRGLRTVDPIEYPNVFKKDCLLLDFARNLEVYTDLEQEVDLIGLQKEGMNIMDIFNEPQEKTEITLKEVEKSMLFSEERRNLFEKYNVFWEFFDSDMGFVSGCCGYKSSIFVVNNNIFYQEDKRENSRFLLIKDTINLDKLINDCMMGEEENKKRINEPINKAQINILFGKYNIASCSSYRASVMINFEFNKKQFVELLKGIQMKYNWSKEKATKYLTDNEITYNELKNILDSAEEIFKNSDEKSFVNKNAPITYSLNCFKGWLKEKLEVCKFSDKIKKTSNNYGKTIASSDFIVCRNILWEFGKLIKKDKNDN